MRSFAVAGKLSFSEIPFAVITWWVTYFRNFSIYNSRVRTHLFGHGCWVRQWGSRYPIWNMITITKQREILSNTIFQYYYTNIHIYLQYCYTNTHTYFAARLHDKNIMFQKNKGY